MNPFSHLFREIDLACRTLIWEIDFGSYEFCRRYIEVIKFGTSLIDVENIILLYIVKFFKKLFFGGYNVFWWR